MLQKKLQIGNINITNALLMAPMEGITDLPFRLICKELGADIVYTEFVASEALIRDIPKSMKKILLADEERPVSVQIFGNDPMRMAEAAKIAQEEGADFVDINYGCWVKKVVAHNSGSALMKDPTLMAEITNQCTNACSVPITIKTRLGWDENNINIYEIAKMQQQAGAKAITVHCRTRQQKITGRADWSFIPKIKEHITIPLILNGDIFTPELALTALQVDGADAVMIARGAVGNPFIFRDAKQLITATNDNIALHNAETAPNPDLAESTYFHNAPIILPIQQIEDDATIIRERIDYCIKHLLLNIQYKGEKGIYDFRKHYSGYLRGFYNASNIRQKLVVENNSNKIVQILNEYFDFLISENKLEISNTSETHKVTCRRNL
jgi:tRNA-dihydrouridine synthase B